MAVQFEGGVVIGADSRTTTGSYIVSICSSGLGLGLIHFFPSYPEHINLVSLPPYFNLEHNDSSFNYHSVQLTPSPFNYHV
jgi:hypothetical protein